MIRKNIAANIMSKGWNVVSLFIFTPLYIKLLGVEAYGLVGFYSTLLAMLTFADMGFTATLTREVAKYDKNDAEENKYILNLLRSYELLYLLISLLIFCGIWFLSSFIVNNWLNLSSALNQQHTTWAVRCMGVALALQLPADLFFGGLMGLQHQIKANLIQILWGAFRAVGAVAVMYFYSATILSFAVWQLFSNLLYCFIIRYNLWYSLNKTNYRAHFDKQVFNNTWRYSLGMALMAMMTICLTQSDKLIISKLLPLSEFTYYSIAVSVASIPLVVANPIANAIFPRFTSTVAKQDIHGMNSLYLKVTLLVSVLTITTGMVLIFFSKEFIYAWTGSKVISINSYKIAIFLTIGQLLQSITVIPYYVALAYGNIKINLRIGILSIVILLPLLFIIIGQLGIVGGGISWAVVNIIITPIYMFYIHKKFLKGLLCIWLTRSILVPCIIIITIISIFKLFTYHLSMDRVQIFPMMVAIWLIASSMSYFITNTMWRQERCHI